MPNKLGGKKYKQMKKGSDMVGNKPAIQFASGQYEYYALVDKLLGNGRFQVKLIKPTESHFLMGGDLHIAHLPGRMKINRSKNMVKLNSILLVQKRDFANANCKIVDILCVYDDENIRFLRQNGEININPKLLTSNKFMQESVNTNEIEFTEQDDNDECKMNDTNHNNKNSNNNNSNNNNNVFTTTEWENL